MSSKKVLRVLEYELPVKIERDAKGGFVARCPAWADCYAQGESIDEVVNEIAAVTASLIELYQEERLPIPLRSSISRKTTFKIPVLISS